MRTLVPTTRHIQPYVPTAVRARPGTREGTGGRPHAPSPGRAEGRLRTGHPADPGGELLLLPRAGEAEVRPPARRQGGGVPRRARGAGDRPGEERRERADRPRRDRRARPGHAAQGGPAHRRAGRPPPRLDRPGGDLAGSPGRGGDGDGDALGLPPAEPPRRAAGEGGALGPQPDRPLHPGPAGEGGPEALARGRQDHPHPPAEPRPDRPAADDRGGRSRSSPTRRPTPTRSSSSACWPRPTTASAGAGTGSTRPATPTATATRRTSRATSGSTATGSSTPSTATCPTTSSSSSSSPATCCRTPTQDQIVATGFLRNSMINEEGGIDPEQFRMEAMFDRMDAIGKGVLGLTIQCAQCHNHKFDPITQEEYYRLFAFLNNDHEAARVVYTPEEQMRVADIARQIREIEMELQRVGPRLARADGRWEDEQAQDGQPKWTVVQAPFEEISTGGQKYQLQPDGSFLAAGLRPDQAHGQDDREGRPAQDHRLPARAAQRPEPARQRPGPLVQGHVRPDRVRGRGRARPTRPDEEGEGQARQGDGRLRAAGVAPGAELRRQARTSKRVVGPVAFAIDGKDETAWGIDAGPGRRNVPREAVFVAEKPIELPRRHRADVQPRRRSTAAGTATTTDQQPRPLPPLGHRRPRPDRRPACPARPRDPGHPAREAHAGPGRRGLLLLADDRARVEGGQRPDRGPLEGPPGRDDARWSSRRRPSRGRPASSSAATSSSRPSRSAPACPRSSTRSPPTPRRRA